MLKVDVKYKFADFVLFDGCLSVIQDRIQLILNPDDSIRAEYWVAKLEEYLDGKPVKTYWAPEDQLIPIVEGQEFLAGIIQARSFLDEAIKDAEKANGLVKMRRGVFDEMIKRLKWSPDSPKELTAKPIVSSAPAQVFDMERIPIKGTGLNVLTND